MIKKKIYLLIWLTIAASTIVFLLVTNLKPKKEKDLVGLMSQKVSGNWEWEKDSEVSAFSVIIERYIGRYIAVAHRGEHIDARLEDEDPSFNIEKLDNGEVIVDFATSGGAIGKVKLRFLNDKLYWDIVEGPDGICYCPQSAVLLRGNQDSGKN